MTSWGPEQVMLYSVTLTLEKMTHLQSVLLSCNMSCHIHVINIHDWYCAKPGILHNT